MKAPPPSSDTTEALAEEAPPLSEEAKKVKTTKTPSNELELSKEKAPEPAASSAALLSKPAKKPLVGRKPPAAEKVRVFGVAHLNFCYQHLSSGTNYFQMISSLSAG